MKITIALIALCLTGCVSSGTQVKDSALEKFQKGVTTETDVVQALGQPQGRSTSLSGQHSISYVGMHASPKAASFIPIVGLFAGGANAQTSVVVFVFDSNGKLSEMSSQQSQSSVNTGLVPAKEVK